MGRVSVCRCSPAMTHREARLHTEVKYDSPQEAIDCTVAG